MRTAAALLAAALLSGCAFTVPVAVVSNDGRDIMHGTATAAVSGGTFEVKGTYNGRPLSCSGTYDALSMAETITMATTCSDGRKGTVTAHRDETGMNGSGSVALEDGTSAIFVFGNDAKAY